MPVALLPPVTGSGGEWRGQQPLTSAARYLRGPGNSRWHRIRCGVRYPTGSTNYTFWCGPGASESDNAGPLWLVDDLPADEPACGTCVGRALGAGQDKAPADLPPLRFDPRWQAPPRFCPGSRSRTLWEPVEGAHGSVGRCLACDQIVAVRVVGRGYNAWGAGPIFHAPGGRLIEPCPFHAWMRVVEDDGRARCACGWPAEQVPAEVSTDA